MVVLSFTMKAGPKHHSQVTMESKGQNSNRNELDPPGHSQAWREQPFHAPSR